MYIVKSIKWKPLIISLLISLGVGGLAGWLTMNSMDVYASIVKPALSPPSVVFPIVWTVLYVLMGISAYLVYITRSPARKIALLIYAAQLLVNFLWSLIFFNMQNYWLAFWVLIVLWVLILAMILTMASVNKTAALLQIPYLLWVTFAGYLNLAIALLNP